MNIVSIVQARMGSTRLPGKVLADIAGITLIDRIIARVRAAPSVGSVVVATSDSSEDDELVEHVRKTGLASIYRGSEFDVLARFAGAATMSRADIVVRITADDPFKDAEVIEQGIGLLVSDTSLDYCSNTLRPTYPEGLDVEVFRASALHRAHSEAKLPSEREHVTPFIWKNPGLFRALNFEYERDLSSWRWTVDYPEDLEFARNVYSHFRDQPLISFKTIIAWLEGAGAGLARASDAVRNEGYLKSIAAERTEP